MKYVAANGSRIPNLGQMVVVSENSLGTAGKIIFQVSELTKPLVSVPKLIDEVTRLYFINEHHALYARRVVVVVIILLILEIMI